MAVGRPPNPPPAPKPKTEPAKPVLDRSQHMVEIGGEQGVKYMQGNAYFNARGEFVRHTEGPGLAPLTPEQEQARQRQLARNRAFFSRAQKPRPDDLPAKVLEVSRERAQILAAETLSE